MRRRACERVATESASIARTHAVVGGVMVSLNTSVSTSYFFMVSIEVVSSEQSGLESSLLPTVAQRRGFGMKFNRYVVLFCALFLGTVAGDAFAQADEDELVILLLVDALRPDHISGLGYDKPTTPKLDARLPTARIFERAYVNAPWTRPSTACFLTGLNASRHQAESARTKLSPNVVTLAERLKKLGWKTAGFTANGNGGSLARLEQGFDFFEILRRPTQRKFAVRPTTGFRPATLWCSRLRNGCRKTQLVSVSLFLFLVDPHDPYAAPKEIEKMFLKGYKGKLRRTPSWEYNNDYPKAERDAIIALYDASIRYTDDVLERFWRYLEGLKSRDRDDGLSDG